MVDFADMNPVMIFNMVIGSLIYWVASECAKDAWQCAPPCWICYNVHRCSCFMLRLLVNASYMSKYLYDGGWEMKLHHVITILAARNLNHV